MINNLSVRSYIIFPAQYQDGKIKTIGSGTAFIAKRNGRHYLITNRHNVTGKDNFTGKYTNDYGRPDVIIAVLVSSKTTDTRIHWKEIEIPLVDNDNDNLWFEHPSYKEKTDFVALPLEENSDFLYMSYHLDESKNPIFVGPSDIVSIIGFPFGKAAGGLFGIWVTGFVASEPSVDINSAMFEGHSFGSDVDLPIFLVDSRTRPGLSGSPVVAYRDGSNVVLESGAKIITSNSMHRLMGIYSRRINKESDIGIVWKANAIAELLDSI